MEERQLINTENAAVVTKDGSKQNSDLLYTIRLIRLALDQFNEQQLAQMDMAIKHQRVAKALALRGDKKRTA